MNTKIKYFRDEENNKEYVVIDKVIHKGDTAYLVRDYENKMALLDLATIIKRLKCIPQ